MKENPDTRIVAKNDGIEVIQIGDEIDFIPDSECNCAEDILAWLVYYEPKGCVTKEFLGEFVSTQLGRHNINIRKLFP